MIAPPIVKSLDSTHQQPARLTELAAKKCRFYEEKLWLLWIWSYLWTQTHSPSTSQKIGLQGLDTAGIRCFSVMSIEKRKGLHSY